MNNQQNDFNGHVDYEHWNVALYICNDSGLCHMAKLCLASSPDDLKQAAKNFVTRLAIMGVTETPEGVTYTVERVKAAMELLG